MGAASLVSRLSRRAVGINSHDMREIMGAGLSGVGMEIGAFDSPFPVPLDCSVLYGDTFDYRSVTAPISPESRLALVIPNIKARFEDLEAISNDSLDFFVASHVIEHTRNPIGAILGALAKLRQGGSLLLVVPDKERTFDKERELTTLDHLIADHEQPSFERDEQHYREYYKLAEPVPEAVYEQTWRMWAAQNYPIHYHTWTLRTFLEMVDEVRRRAGIALEVSSHSTLVETGGFEFYVRMTKAA